MLFFELLTLFHEKWILKFKKNFLTYQTDCFYKKNITNKQTRSLYDSTLSWLLRSKVYVHRLSLNRNTLPENRLSFNQVHFFCISGQTNLKYCQFWPKCHQNYVNNSTQSCPIKLKSSLAWWLLVDPLKQFHRIQLTSVSVNSFGLLIVKIWNSLYLISLSEKTATLEMRMVWPRPCGRRLRAN